MKFGVKLKRIAAISLAGILAAGVLAACGTNNTNNSDNSKSTSSSVKTEKDDDEKSDETGNETTSTFSPKADDKQSTNDAAPTIIPQTAEEAANDIEAIENEIASLEELIADGNFDDALMQIRALLTKNLSDAQKEVIETYKTQIEDKMGGGLSD